MKSKELVPAAFQSPFTLMRRLSDEMERMFDDFNIRRPLALLAPEIRTFEWAPAIEVVEKDKKLFVRAELPGLTKDDVKIELTDELLTIKGERKQEREEKKEGYFQTERFYGSFFRQVALPEGVNAETARAIFKDGILEIQLPIEVKKPIGRTLPIEEPKKEEKKELVGV